MSALDKIESMVRKELDGYAKQDNLSNQAFEMVDHLTHTLKSIKCIKETKDVVDTVEMSDEEKLEAVKKVLGL